MPCGTSAARHQHSLSTDQGQNRERERERGRENLGGRSRGDGRVYSDRSFFMYCRMGNLQPINSGYNSSVAKSTSSDRG